MAKNISLAKNEGEEEEGRRTCKLMIDEERREGFNQDEKRNMLPLPGNHLTVNTRPGIATGQEGTPNPHHEPARGNDGALNDAIKLEQRVRGGRSRHESIMTKTILQQRAKMSLTRVRERGASSRLLLELQLERAIASSPNKSIEATAEAALAVASLYVKQNERNGKA